MGEMQKPADNLAQPESPRFNFSRREILKMAVAAALNNGLLGKLAAAVPAGSVASAVNCIKIGCTSNPNFLYEILCMASYEDCQISTFFNPDGSSNGNSLLEQQEHAWTSMIWNEQEYGTGKIFGLSETEIFKFKSCMVSAEENARALVAKNDPAYLAFRQEWLANVGIGEPYMEGCKDNIESTFLYTCQEHSVRDFIMKNPYLNTLQSELRTKSVKWANALKDISPESAERLNTQLRYEEFNPTRRPVDLQIVEIEDEINQLKMPGMSFRHWVGFSGQGQLYELSEANEEIENLESRLELLRKMQAETGCEASLVESKLDMHSYWEKQREKRRLKNQQKKSE